MRPAARIQATIELLDEIIQHGHPADRVMAHYFRRNRYIGSKDKAAISEYFYTVLRKRLSYEYLLKASNVSANSRFLVAMMLREQGQELQHIFSGEKYAPPGFAVNVREKLTAIEFEDLQSAPVHVQLNVPEWLAPELERSLGDRYEVEINASNQRAKTDIRVNTLKTSLENTLKTLVKSGYSAEVVALSPWGLRFSGRVALFGLDIFQQGWFEVQDQGSQLLALMTAVQPGDRVVDFCAGAGGKTLAMSSMMENKGRIYACDVHSKRLKQLSLRAKRAGADNISVRLLGSERDKWVKQQAGKADVVLVDAPCSGTGTWRRSPDSRWNLQPEGLQNLLQLQQSILQSASRLVKPDGRLLYASCSLLQQENEQQISRFLQQNSEFELGELTLHESLARHLDKVDYQTHQLKMFPALSETDGFYVCELRRKVTVKL